MPGWVGSASTKRAWSIAGRGASLHSTGTYLLLLPSPAGPPTSTPIPWGRASSMRAFLNSHLGTNPLAAADRMAHPLPTALSGSTDVHNSGGVGGGKRRLSMERIEGVRVDPPTSITSSMGGRSPPSLSPPLSTTLPARAWYACMASLTTPSARATSGAMALSNSSREIVTFAPSKSNSASRRGGDSSIPSSPPALPHNFSLASRHRPLSRRRRAEEVGATLASPSPRSLASRTRRARASSRSSPPRRLSPAVARTRNRTSSFSSSLRPFSPEGDEEEEAMDAMVTSVVPPPMSNTNMAFPRGGTLSSSLAPEGTGAPFLGAPPATGPPTFLASEDPSHPAAATPAEGTDTAVHPSSSSLPLPSSLASSSSSFPSSSFSPPSAPSPPSSGAAAALSSLLLSGLTNSPYATAAAVLSVTVPTCPAKPERRAARTTALRRGREKWAGTPRTTL
mmetsp:Transcript_33811/g.100860  ORF Transcript_33811/g.100860 Transcript_33811/m.100860 type:complete len:451 (+) Transcript_33811:3577-4929(+)